MDRADKPRGSLADTVRAQRARWAAAGRVLPTPDGRMPMASVGRDGLVYHDGPAPAPHWLSAVPRENGSPLERPRPPERPELPFEAAKALFLAESKPYESLEWLRRWAAQGSDPLADVRRYTTPPADPGPQPVPLVGWMHIATIGSWEPILRELLSAVERSGLLAATERIYAGVVGPEADLSWLPEWLTVVKRDGPLNMGENSTLAALWDWSKTAPASKVFYLHTKGASHPGNANVTAWRDYLTWANVLRWRDCATALDTHDACGTDYVDVDNNPWFVNLWGAVRLRPGSRGFPGNWWWGRSDYLAEMPASDVRLDQDRWNSEWNFAGAGRPDVKVFHESRVNYYNEYYGRERYDP